MDSDCESPTKEVDCQDVLEAYAALRSRFRNMRHHAESGEWQSLIDQNASYIAEWEWLQFLEARADLGAEETLEKQSLMREVLEESEKVRHCLVERREHIADLIRETSSKHSGTSQYAAVRRLSPRVEHE